jgi:5-methylcytosine-specific restriction endonuclease McrA
MRGQKNTRTTLKKQQYHQYLASAAWKSKRGQVLERDGHKCRFCGATREGCNRLEVHHIYYSRTREQETLDQLITLCNRCHAARHGTKSIEHKLHERGIKKATHSQKAHKAALSTTDHDQWLRNMEAQIKHDEAREALQPKKYAEIIG